MGILNLTPDSFSDGGNFLSSDDALRQAEKLIKDGADILDIGAESSRPGAAPVSAEAEIDRLTPFLTRYSGHFDTPLSLDTYKSQTAEFGLTLGVSIINDITGLKGDPQMAKVIARFQAPAIVMHMQGTPQTMQQNPHYQHILDEVKAGLSDSIQIAETQRITQLIIDPGIGFGKTVEDNFKLVAHLTEFESLRKPILIGISRKSCLGAITGSPVHDRAPESLAAGLLSVLKGAQFLRVHDVKWMRNALLIVEAIGKETSCEPHI